MQGHGGVGVVEAVGPEVRRVQVGDRVCVSGTPQCGSCYHCLRGRADVCQLLGRNLAGDLVPVADLRDGTPVYSNSHIGGLAELMITFEEWVVPVVTKANAVDLGMVLSCVSVAGLGATTTGTLATVAPGSVGRGRRLRTARPERRSGRAHCRRVDDHRHRSDQGAPRAGDEGRRDARARSQRRRRRASSSACAACRMDRPAARGAAAATRADDAAAPARISSSRRRARSSCGRSSKQGPDPTGILPMQQAYRDVQRRRPSGHDRPRARHDRAAGVPLRDWRDLALRRSGRRRQPDARHPSIRAMLDSGQYDAKALVTRVVPLADMLGAYEKKSPIARRSPRS